MEISAGSQDVKEAAEFGRCDDAASQGRLVTMGRAVVWNSKWQPVTGV